MFPQLKAYLLVRHYWQDLVALGAGVLLPLAFAPYNFSGLALLSPALLFVVWLNASPRRAFWRGFLFGLGQFGVGVSWVYISMSQFGGVPALLAFGLSALFVAFWALFPAALGLLQSLLSSSLTRHLVILRLLLIMPGAWVLVEWVRGWFLTGFPWLNLGYSQTDSPLAGFAPVLGVYGVTLVTIMGAALLALLIVATSKKTRLWLCLGLVCLYAGGALLGLVSWTKANAKPLKVSLIQGNIPQDLKWQPAMKQVTLDIYAQQTRLHLDSDLIIWPETALPDYLHRLQPWLEEISGEAKQQQTGLLVGTLYLDKDNGRYYNSMVGLGLMQGLYHKRHLVPFTEYLPLKSVLGGLVDFMAVPMSNFGRGASQQPLFEIKGQKITVSICYEDVFGEEIRTYLPQANILVNVSNDAWFGDSSAPAQHLQIARMRAMEMGRPMLRATNTGVSAIIDERGVIKVIAPQFETSVLTAQVQGMSGTTPYVWLGNWPAVMTALLMLLVARILKARARGRTAIKEEQD